MAKKKRKSTRERGETWTSFTFPTLHQKVIDAISDVLTDVSFHEDIDNTYFEEKYSTSVTGTFRYHRDTCRSSY